MAIDATRAALVTQEYRYRIVEDAAIKARHPAAKEVVIETNLPAGAGDTLATTLFNATSTFTTVFEVEVEGLFFAEDFLDGMPRYTLRFDRHPATGTQTYQVITVKPRLLANRTVLAVRG